ncbi:MAG: amidohydrolase family protein, partial [Bacteroidales bacterium]|nr:amidohydrolase family protein [Bacteroidales bacterium]
MNALLIKNVILDGSKKDILVKGSLISKIADHIECEGCEILDAKGMTAMPGFINLHTHTAMTLVRGVKEDMPLNEWLQAIWKIEANLDDESAYWGAKLAALEMIKSGTTTFLDMYFRIPYLRKAFYEMGLRGFYSYVIINTFDPEVAKRQKAECQEQYAMSLDWGDNSTFAVAAHADYTVDRDTIIWAKSFADENGLKFNFHTCETQQEVERAYVNYGMSPLAYFDSLGVLDSNSIAAHCVW